MDIWADGSSLNNQRAADRVAACRVTAEDGTERTFPLGDATNNIAEIKAIRRALEYAAEKGVTSANILSDSKCALAWVERGLKDGPMRCLPKNSTLPPERRAIVRCEVAMIDCLRDVIGDVKFSYCPGSENRADFGHKR